MKYHYLLIDITLVLRKSHQTRHQKNAEIYDQHIRLRFQKYRKNVKGVRK